METFKKLAPFLRRAGVVEIGRERLLQIRKRLAYVLISTDISENSRKMVLESFPCPVYQCLTSEEIESLLGYRGTKLLGFHRSPLANSVLPDLRPHRVTLPSGKQ